MMSVSKACSFLKSMPLNEHTTVCLSELLLMDILYIKKKKYCEHSYASISQIHTLIFPGIDLLFSCISSVPYSIQFLIFNLFFFSFLRSHSFSMYVWCRILQSHGGWCFYRICYFLLFCFLCTGLLTSVFICTFLSYGKFYVVFSPLSVSGGPVHRSLRFPTSDWGSGRRCLGMRRSLSRLWGQRAAWDFAWLGLLKSPWSQVPLITSFGHKWSLGVLERHVWQWASTWLVMQSATLSFLGHLYSSDGQCNHSPLLISSFSSLAAVPLLFGGESEFCHLSISVHLGHIFFSTSLWIFHFSSMFVPCCMG